MILQKRLAILVGLVLVAGGIGVFVWTAVVGALPTYLPIIAVVLGAAVAVFGSAVSPASAFGRHAGTISIGFIALVVTVIAAATDRRYVEHHAARWSVGPPSSAWPNEKHVRVELSDHPGFVMGFHSTPLANCLKDRAAGRSVVITFEVMKDFGSVRGYSVRAIGPCHSPLDAAWSYSELSNHARTPF